MAAMPRLASSFHGLETDALPWPRRSGGATAWLRPRWATFFDEGPVDRAVDKVLQLNGKVVNVTGRLHEAQLKESWRMEEFCT